MERVDRVIELSDVYVRYEPNVNFGTVYLFNRKNGIFYEGDNCLNELIELIDGTRSVENICDIIEQKYENSHDVVVSIINELIHKGFVILK